MHHKDAATCSTATPTDLVAQILGRRYELACFWLQHVNIVRLALLA